MHIELIRFHKSKESLDGKLLVDGQKLCDTSECQEGALKAGHYQIVRHFCKQYNRFVPLIFPLTDKPDPESFCQACPKQKYVSNNTTLPIYCPQLKMGNGIHNRNDGSIIMGTRIVPGCLKLPREPYENLSERIRKIAGRGNEITLSITEAYPKPINHFNL